MSDNHSAPDFFELNGNQQQQQNGKNNISTRMEKLRKKIYKYISICLEKLNKLRFLENERPARAFKEFLEGNNEQRGKLQEMRHILFKLYDNKLSIEQQQNIINDFLNILRIVLDNYLKQRRIYGREPNQDPRSNPKLLKLLQVSLIPGSEDKFKQSLLNELLENDYLDLWISILINDILQRADDEEENLRNYIKSKIRKIKMMLNPNEIERAINEFDIDPFIETFEMYNKAILKRKEEYPDHFEESYEELKEDMDNKMKEEIRRRKEEGEWKEQRDILNRFKEQFNDINIDNFDDLTFNQIEDLLKTLKELTKLFNFKIRKPKK